MTVILLNMQHSHIRVPNKAVYACCNSKIGIAHRYQWIFISSIFAKRHFIFFCRFRLITIKYLKLSLKWRIANGFLTSLQHLHILHGKFTLRKQDKRAKLQSTTNKGSPVITHMYINLRNSTRANLFILKYH